MSNSVPTSAAQQTTESTFPSAQTLEAPDRSAVVCAPLDLLRVGVVGLGLRGECLLRLLVEQTGVQIRAVCDLDEDRVGWARQLVADAGQNAQVGCHQGENGYQALCDRGDLDLVIVATPWAAHVPVCVAGLRAGQHVAVDLGKVPVLDMNVLPIHTSSSVGIAFRLLV